MVIGTAIAIDQKAELAIRGRDMVTGLPREILVKEAHVRSAISKSLRIIVDAIREVIETTPPELVGDILKRGMYLCGGGSLLKGIDRLIQKDLTVATTIVDDPLTCVARGTGVITEQFEKYYAIVNNPLRPREINI